MYNPGGWWERRGWAAGTALVGPLGPGALSLPPKAFKPRKSEGRALSQAPQTVGVLWMQGQAGPELPERGEEPEVRGAGRPRPAGVTLCRPQVPELFSTLYHPSVRSWPQSRGHSCYTLSLPEAPRPLAPTRARCLVLAGGRALCGPRPGGEPEAVRTAAFTFPACLSHTPGYQWGN